MDYGQLKSMLTVVQNDRKKDEIRKLENVSIHLLIYSNFLSSNDDLFTDQTQSIIKFELLLKTLLLWLTDYMPKMLLSCLFFAGT